MADSRLSHRNIIVQCSELGQKAANGKNRPNLDTRRNVCLEIEAYESSHSPSTPSLSRGLVAKRVGRQLQRLVRRLAATYQTAKRYE
jgi:hypothetical protein